MYSNCYRFNNLYIGLIQPKKIAYVRMQSFFLYSYLEKHEKERDGKEMIKFGKGSRKAQSPDTYYQFCFTVSSSIWLHLTQGLTMISFLSASELVSMKGQDNSGR